MSIECAGDQLHARESKHPKALLQSTLKLTWGSINHEPFETLLFANAVSATSIQ